MRAPVVMILLAVPVLAHATDTLRFHSTAFGTGRMVIVHTPQFFHAASEQVRMPVFIVLDGQHDWFVEPVLNDIRYLQYTHEVPQAITVVVPHADRVRESAGRGDEQDVLPLLRMLTDELPPLLKPYPPGDYTVLIGHSFTASFALHAKQQAPDAFDAVIALSPLHRVDAYLPALAAQLRERGNDDVLLAVGGADRSKDGGHHATLMNAWNTLPTQKGRMVLREYPTAGHTSLPVIAFPELLSTLFMDFSLRDSLAPVNDEYQLVRVPGTPEEEMRKVEASLRFRSTELPWEVAEINGLASRYDASGYAQHVLAIYRRGAELYPEDVTMNWYLGEALLGTDRSAAEKVLRKALMLLEREPIGEAERAGARAEIEALLK
ncbi:MAG: hypothetical protein KF797_02850 [Flavobacteriales bacterium]|nr:hypothetical protein [Flavobacteriales bacterium]